MIPVLVLNFRIQHPRNSESLKYPSLGHKRSKIKDSAISGQKSFPRWCPLIKVHCIQTLHRYRLSYLTQSDNQKMKTAYHQSLNTELAKLRALRACVSSRFTCIRALRAWIFLCLNYMP